MNAPFAQTDFISDDEFIDAVRAQLMSDKEKTNKSWTDYAKVTGVPSGTLSQWGPDKYPGNNLAIAQKVNNYFNEIKEATEAKHKLFSVPDFVATETANKIFAVLLHAKQGEIVAIFGNPGVGKTASIKMFQRHYSNVWLCTLSPSTSNLKAALLEITRSLGLQIQNGPSAKLSRLIREYVRAKSGLLVIDEVQNAEDKTIEELRAIYDETNVGMAFCGNFATLNCIEGDARAASHAQRFSRISMRLSLDKSTQKDISAILNEWKIIDPNEVEFLNKVAARKGGGAIRTLTKTLSLANKLSDGGTKPINLHVIQSAYAQLSSKDLGVI